MYRYHCPVCIKWSGRERKKYFQNFRAGNHIRGKSNINCFRMSGISTANVFISRVYLCPAVYPERTRCTPFTSVNTASRHQKHPPARVAVSSLIILLLPVFRPYSCNMVNAVLDRELTIKNWDEDPELPLLEFVCRRVRRLELFFVPLIRNGR